MFTLITPITLHMSACMCHVDFHDLAQYSYALAAFQPIGTKYQRTVLKLAILMHIHGYFNHAYS